MKKEKSFDDNLTNKEENKLYQQNYFPFYNNLNNYLINYIIPQSIAFYLANIFEYNCLGHSPLKNHLNSALELFNVICNIDELMPLIEKELLIKYHLKIIKKDPLTFKRVLMK